MMRCAVRSELVVEGASPSGEQNGLSGKLMKALAQELGAGQTPMDPVGFAAAFGDRGNAGQHLNLGGTFEAVAIGAKGRQQARSQGGAGSREAVKQGVVIVLLEAVFELLIKLLDGFDQAAQLSDQGRDHQLGGRQDG